VQAIDGHRDAKLEALRPCRKQGSAYGLTQTLYARWEYLAGQEAFRRAGLILRRLISWRIRCLLRQA